MITFVFKIQNLLLLMFPFSYKSIWIYHSMPEIEKWLSEHENNTIIMRLKEKACYAHNGGWCEDCNEINVTISYRKEICYEPDLTYEWGEDPAYLEEHEVDFENIAKLIFEDYEGSEVKQLNL